jgi:hypothetical protein
MTPDGVAPTRSISFRMPFTVSHAAAVLPFRKLNLVSSAFIIGSMAPDFPYIVGSSRYRDVAHVMPGILEFTIPASLVALWLFHNVIKRPVIDLLPTGMQVRLRDQVGAFAFGGIRRFLAILGSIVIGIATHLIWDSFTHSHSWAYRHVGWLRGWAYVPFVGIMPMHSALQYTSSVVGIVALALWILLWYRKTPVAQIGPQPHPKSRFALGATIFFVAGTLALVRAFLEVGAPAIRSNAHAFLLVFSVTSLELAFWQLLLYCVLVSTHQTWIIT